MSRRRTPPTLPVRLPILAAAVALLTLTACSSGGSSGSGESLAAPTSAAPVTVAGSVVSTAGSSNEAQIVVPEVVAAQWAALGSGNGVEWVAVAGDGTTSTTPVAVADADATSAFTAQLNALQAASPGRDALAGLDAVASPA